MLGIFSFFLTSFIFLILKAERKREEAHFHSLIHYPNVHNSMSQARARNLNLIHVSHVGDSHHRLPENAIAGGWNQKLSWDWNPVTLICDVGSLSGVFTTVTNASP